MIRSSEDDDSDCIHLWEFVVQYLAKIRVVSALPMIHIDLDHLYLVHPH